MTRAEHATIDQQRRELDGHGERIRTPAAGEAYREGWDRIFGKKPAKRRKGATHAPGCRSYRGPCYCDPL